MAKKISLIEEIKQGGYEASLFTTFNAYLPFYEDVVLRKLVSSGTRHNVLLMDEGQFAQSVANDPPQFAGRHYSLVPMHSNGAFHPKIILLLGKKKGSLFVGSHNLTLSGFGFNREITNLVSLQDKEDADAVEAISSAWIEIQGWVTWQGDRLPKHLVEMVRKVASFAPWLQKEVRFRRENLSLISTGPESASLWHQLRDQMRGRAKRVIISGAFFDNNLEFINRVQTDLNPVEFFVGIDPSTVHIPSDAINLSGVNFVNCSQIGETETNKKESAGYLHAKSVFIETEGKAVYLASGSANPSRPAWMHDEMAGNIEMMLVRMGYEAEIVAREIGILDIPTMPGLSVADWNLIRKNWRSEKNDYIAQSFKMGIALATDKGITFRAHVPDLPEAIVCELLDQNKEKQVSVQASLLHGEYGIGIDLLDPKKPKASYVRCSIGEKKLLFLVHDKEQIKQHSRTGIQRRFRDALNSLNSDTPDIVTLIQCVDKIMFSTSKDARATAVKLSAGKRENEKEDENTTEDGASLSVDIVETRKTKKKLRLRVSDDLAYLLDALIYHLRLDKAIEMPVESVDGKGRSEEEQVGTEDADDSVDEHADEETATSTLNLCHGKVHTLVGRMVNQLNELKKDKVPLEDIIVRLTGVLALLRHLRGCDGKIFWIKPGQTSFPQKERKKLLVAVAGSLFEGEDSMLYCGGKSDGLDESEDMARLKGLLLWLAWDCALVLDLEKPFNEAPEKWAERIANNALVLAFSQLAKDDDVIIHEAKQSIAPLSASDMDWLDWVLSTGEKISKFISSPEEFAMGGSIKPGDLAFHPKVPSLGVRTVLNQVLTKTNLISFDPSKQHIAYLTDYIRVAPLDKVIQDNPL